MSRKHLNTLIAFICLLTISCDNKERETKIYNELSSLIGRQLNFDQLEIYCSNINNCDSSSLDKGEFKIITLIDAECGSCIQKIDKWDEWKSELNNLIDLIMVPYANDSLISFSYMIDLDTSTNNFFFMDYNSSFISTNSLPEDPMFHTMLIDNNNEIVLAGSPLESKAISELYVEYLSKK